MSSNPISSNPVPTNLAPSSLADSYAHCAHVAKTRARNFYYSFITLSAEQRAAMCAIYAFMRYSDDVSDDAVEDRSREHEMADWRAALHRAFDGDYGGSLILPAFHDTVKRYAIPARYFHELIDGTEMDLTKTRYENFDELHQYCYRVASVVGFVCIHVWGFDPADGMAIQYAEDCGLALQLTNILRDVREDAERDRIYIPQEDLRRFGVSEEDLKSGAMTSQFRELMVFEVDRAKGYYERAAKLTPLIHRAGRATLMIMTRIYRGILDSIERNNYDVHSKRARVSTPKKLGIVAGAWLRGMMR